MDDGYGQWSKAEDRAEVAEQRLSIAIDALKHIGRRFEHARPMVKSTLNQIEKFGS